MVEKAVEGLKQNHDCKSRKNCYSSYPKIMVTFDLTVKLGFRIKG